MKEYLPKIINFFSKIAPRLTAGYALKKFATPSRIPRPQSEMEVYASSKKFFLKDGIAAFEWGNPTHPLVMLIHGWNGRGTQIAAFAKSLVEKNFRVVALDGPGHGISPGKMTNPKHYADFILNAQKELAPEGAQSVIAHSFGGGSAVLAVTYGMKVKSLVLVASPAFYERVVNYFATNFGLNKKSELIFTEMVSDFATIHPRDLNIAQLGSQLKIPALIVHDEGDTAVQYKWGEAIHAAWPGSILFTTQGLGHRRILKDPKVIAYVTDFIAKN
ncbi:MAG: alpha/beta fold hydrolase [Rhizobacter sp.]|nr:alpha/beta fold hydrolase [Bacteriovorax sp.]